MCWDFAPGYCANIYSLIYINFVTAGIQWQYISIFNLLIRCFSTMDALVLSPGFDLVRC